MTGGYRVGQGFDAHRLRKGERLVLGGVRIPSERGLVGHSDADVVLHSLVNALLGAMGKGDIGTHFPDSDARYKGISSAVFLRKVVRMMRQDGFVLVNGDFTILAQRPKLAPFFEKIRGNVARMLKVRKSQINIKAATTEQLGWIGQGKGMAVTSVVLLESRRSRR